MDSERPPAPDDWLADLRAAWRQGPEPASDRPLAEEDLHTRLAVDWMRQAWLALPVPAASAPRRTPALRSRAGWRYAAAAALLLALGVPLAIGAWRHAHRPAAPPAPVATAEPAAPVSPPAPTAPVAPAAPAAPAATIVAIDEHHLELRSGPVRLYLMTDPPPPHPEDLR
jgi:hypothetical protein